MGFFAVLRFILLLLMIKSIILTNVYKIIKFKIDFTIINFITSITRQENFISFTEIYNYYTYGAVSCKIKLCQSQNVSVVGSTENIKKIHSTY